MKYFSMGDASSAALQLDFPLMACGYTLMLVYTVLMLGRPNIVEVRCYLSCVGLFAILMGGAASQGLAFLMGYVFTPMNGILLYLILGICVHNTLLPNFAKLLLRYWHRRHVCNHSMPDQHPQGQGVIQPCHRGEDRPRHEECRPVYYHDLRN